MNPTRETVSPVAHREPASSIAYWKILLAASTTDTTESELSGIRSLLASAVERPIEWDRVLRLADDHGVSSLLYQNLARAGDGVPSEVLAALRRRYERNIHKSLFLMRELIRIMDTLEPLGIEVIPYKGVVLSEVYYGDMAMRQAGDIDLFVRTKNVARIRGAVRELGYMERVAIPEEAEEEFIASGYECSFDSAAGRGVLEVQWALQPRFYAVDFDMEGMFTRAVRVRAAGREVKTPAPEDLLLVLAVHTAKHVWDRLIWLCDIAQILKRENLDWDWVQGRAAELGVRRILHVTLLLANKLLAIPIPEPIERNVVADRDARALADEIGRSLAEGVSYDVQSVGYFRLMMRVRERRVDRWRFFTRLAFTPGPGEWETVRLPKVLFPLYRLVRLARLSTRWVRR